MENVDRDFKGIWISKDIWLNEDLTALDKVIYAEIDSLDNEDGCWASNLYLATFCGCSESKVSKTVAKLKELGLITVENFDGRHRVMRVVKVTMQSSKIYEAESQNLLSNNIAISKEKEDNTISINTNSIANSQNFTFGTKQEKPKKDNLYSKCLALINEFTDDVILQNMLEKCLQMFLGNSKESGIPFYTNTFKGKLNKLKTLSTDNYVQRDIVKQTIDNGWNSFYEIKTNRRKNDIEYVSAELGIVDSVTYTEEERRQQEAWREQMIKDGKQVKF